MSYIHQSDWHSTSQMLAHDLSVTKIRWRLKNMDVCESKNSMLLRFYKFELNKDKIKTRSTII